ncbi:hypothetical protein JTE90_010666 [Oedothorax gibbosus]|uniref:Uncharacterized protein n=1 Tax=Oedothorax gibbosus TaxID=931172 RepID=A0AAV6UQK6_9ARAC|nr:hypothetical protein JTE90_010666 [Oedothorax gibbosus]
MRRHALLKKMLVEQIKALNKNPLKSQLYIYWTNKNRYNIGPRRKIEFPTRNNWETYGLWRDDLYGCGGVDKLGDGKGGSTGNIIFVYRESSTNKKIRNYNLYYLLYKNSKNSTGNRGLDDDHVSVGISHHARNASRQIYLETCLQCNDSALVPLIAS